MGDWKDKLPSVSEVLGFSTKLAKDVKKSVSEIIVDYKKNREQELASNSSVCKEPEAKLAEPVILEQEKKKVEIVEEKPKTVDVTADIKDEKK